MLYHIFEYNKDTGIAKGVEASLYGRSNVTPSSFHVNLLINPSHLNLDIIPGMTYSFIPKDSNFCGTFTRAELDYHKPLP
jgi:hypothetical protein